MSALIGLFGPKALAAIGAAIAFVVGMAAAYLKGKKAERDKNRAADLKAIATRTDVDAEIAARAPDENRKALDRWSR